MNQDNYFFGDRYDAQADYWKKAMITFPEGSCPVAWAPEGWDFKEPESYSEITPDGRVKDYLRDNLDDLIKVPQKRWENAFRFMLVRSQPFINEAMDKNPGYILFQPIKPDAVLPQS